jgi:proline iminopeptidase
MASIPTIVLMSSEDYSTFIPEEERGDLMTAYQKRLTGSDEALSLEAARRWSVWEESTNRLIQDPEGIEKAQTDDKWSRSVPPSLQQPGFLTEWYRAFARIENHYFVNKVRPYSCVADGRLTRRVSSLKMDI